ncbi:MAG: hypothetical protein LC111_08140 [Bacteroidia bacterium]|nr:hypothetical protein [Bacteroidia bacterium]
MSTKAINIEASSFSHQKKEVIKKSDNMNSNFSTIETLLTPKEIVEKLKSVTVTDFAQIHHSLPVSYYGDISSHSFTIKNVRYSPYSSVPPIEGEIVEGINKTLVKVKMNINEHYRLSKKMYYSTLLPIGVIILLLSALVLGGTEYQLQGYLFSGAFILVAFAIVLITKASLINMKKRGLKELTDIIDGHLIP